MLYFYFFGRRVHINFESCNSCSYFGLFYFFYIHIVFHLFIYVRVLWFFVVFTTERIKKNSVDSHCVWTTERRLKVHLYLWKEHLSKPPSVPDSNSANVEVKCMAVPTLHGIEFANTARKKNIKTYKKYTTNLSNFSAPTKNKHFRMVLYKIHVWYYSRVFRWERSGKASKSADVQCSTEFKYYF